LARIGRNLVVRGGESAWCERADMAGGAGGGHAWTWGVLVNWDITDSRFSCENLLAVETLETLDRRLWTRRK
jgi:hypothetical protein